MSYIQLTEEDCIEIYAMKKAEVQQDEIANQIGHHPSTFNDSADAGSKYL